MSKEHAEHNENLCDHLIKLTGFNDWVITTAFYSALHFATSKIFPLTIGSDTYNNIDEYYSKLPTSNISSKHKKIKDLISTYLKPINSHYRWLFDTCRTARYHNYKIKDGKAKHAREQLRIIKSHC